MGGFFGAVLKRDCVLDLFFGVDYHSHLGTSHGGMAVFSEDTGFQCTTHDIGNAPFRTTFEQDLESMRGNSGIGCISDSDPQPVLVRSHLGLYAITTVGAINNSDELIETFFSGGGSHLTAMSGGSINMSELTAALINQKGTFTEGIRHVQDCVDGSISLMILTEDGIIAARDKLGRLPVLIGKNSDGFCVSFESFVYKKLDFIDARSLGPAEIVKITPDNIEVLSPPGEEMKICAFLWTYYGYPNSSYEGVNVEVMRNRNGELMARSDIENGRLPQVDCVAGLPDSGIPHAIGYANETRLPFKRPFVKYTPTWPRSFLSGSQEVRSRIAKMKQIPVPELIDGKKLLFVEDSIVRGTQLHETVDFLYESGATEVHLRSGCPPIMYKCKFLNFTRVDSDADLLVRQAVRELEGAEGEEHISEYSDASTQRGRDLTDHLCKKLRLTSLGYQSIDGLIDSIAIDPCKICTYCWTGQE